MITVTSQFLCKYITEPHELDQRERVFQGTDVGKVFGQSEALKKQLFFKF